MSFHRTTEPVENLGIPQDFFWPQRDPDDLGVQRDLDGGIANTGSLADDLFDHFIDIQQLHANGILLRY